MKLPKSLPNSVLSSVSCPTRGRCVAVGYATKSQRNGEAIESLFVESLKNGAWTITSPATPPDTSAALDAISCPDDSSCLTVGTVAPRNALTRTHPIVEQLDGSSWTQVSLPANGDGPGLLSDVACSSVGYCTAVGRSEVRGGTYSALVLTLLGTSWTTNTDALEQPGNLSLTSVGCATDGGCVAVGSSWPSITKPPRHIVARIDGTSWQELHTSTGTANIENVTCTESTLCLFVGSVTRNLFGNTTTFIASLSGTTWKQQQSPSP